MPDTSPKLIKLLATDEIVAILSFLELSMIEAVFAAKPSQSSRQSSLADSVKQQELKQKMRTYLNQQEIINRSCTLLHDPFRGYLLNHSLDYFNESRLKEAAWALNGQTIRKIWPFDDGCYILTNENILYAYQVEEVKKKKEFWNFFSDNSAETEFKGKVVKVLCDHNIVQLVNTEENILVLTDRGQVFAWGTNRKGQLGVDDKKPRSQPTLISALEGNVIIQLTSRNGRIFALTAEGKVFTWGPIAGSLRDSEHTHRCRSVPTLIASLRDHIITKLEYDYCSNLIYGFNNQGHLLAWQDNAVNYEDRGIPYQRTHPRIIPLLTNYAVNQMQICEKKVFALTKEGRLFTWNRPAHLQHTANISFEIVSNDYLSSEVITQFIADDQRVFALTAKGQVFVWNLTVAVEEANGSQNTGPAEHTHQSISAGYSALKPNLLKALSGHTCMQLSKREASFYILTKEGKIFVWGRNEDGQLGLGDTHERTKPTLIKTLQHQVITKIFFPDEYSGIHSVYALTNTGQLFVWGDNRFSQLGIGNTSNCLLPIKIDLGAPVIHLQVTRVGCIAITKNNQQFVWGGRRPSAILAIQQLPLPFSALYYHTPIPLPRIAPFQVQAKQSLQTLAYALCHAAASRSARRWDNDKMDAAYHYKYQGISKIVYLPPTVHKMITEIEHVLYTYVSERQLLSTLIKMLAWGKDYYQELQSVHTENILRAKIISKFFKPFDKPVPENPKELVQTLADQVRPARL